MVSRPLAVTSACTSPILDTPEQGQNGMKKMALEHNVSPGKQNGFCKRKLVFFGEIHQV